MGFTGGVGALFWPGPACGYLVCGTLKDCVGGRWQATGAGFGEAGGDLWYAGDEHL